jgi:AraC-like DNA-binding protein
MVVSLFIWAAIQSFLFGINILLFKRNKANVFLGVFFILTSLNILLQYLSRFTRWKFDVPEILFISDIIGFLYGPVLFLYARQLIFKNLNPGFYLHFLPAVVFAIFFSVREFIIYAPLSFYDYIDTPFQQLVLFLILLSNLIYFMLFIHTVGHHIYGNRSKGSWITSWISMFYIFFALKVFTGLIFFVYQGLIQPAYNETIATNFRVFTEYAFIIFNSVIIVATGYWAIKNPFELYNLTASNIKKIDEQTPAKESSPARQEIVTDANNAIKPRIPDEEAAGKIELLNKLIKNNVHLDPDMNEQKMAKLMNVSLHYLSSLLNEHIRESFTEFINRNRIEIAKQQLLDKSSSNLTIFAIALDCGYNSESTFYVNFKKFTGMTPKSFKKKHHG